MVKACLMSGDDPLARGMHEQVENGCRSLQHEGVREVSGEAGNHVHVGTWLLGMRMGTRGALTIVPCAAQTSVTTVTVVRSAVFGVRLCRRLCVCVCVTSTCNKF